MLNLWQDPIIRSATPQDSRQLARLLGGNAFIQRHLGWESPLAWLGKDPFYILEAEKEILAALACPPDEDGICWLRLFASRAGFPPGEAWEKLWGQTRDWIQLHQPGLLVNSLVVKPEMTRLLSRAGFQEVSRVVVLVWTSETACWPVNRGNLSVRRMEIEDLAAVYQIDKGAFSLIWRHSFSQLQAAFQESFYATVVDMNGTPAAYQISTVNPQGGHLARLAVDPAYQKRGLATCLLEDLLKKMEDSGFVEVTVNTQSENQTSLELYQKFGFQRLKETYPVYQFDSGLDQ